MNDFPNIPLSRYTEAEDGREEGRKRFIRDLKAWLKKVDLDLDFLCRNLGKTLGTIRNWMTGSIDINDAKLERILELCQAHTTGGKGVIYKETLPEGTIDYIWVKPYLLTKRQKMEGVGSEHAETIEVKVKHGWYKFLYDKWCAAAGVPQDTLYNQKAMYYPALARFVTDTIMLATQKTLQKAQKDGKLNRAFLRCNGGIIEEEEKENGVMDTGAVLQGAPCACSFFAGWIIGDNGKMEKDGSRGRKDICFFLPVIREKWRGDFARLAAATTRYPNTDIWMAQQLNKAALQLVGNDLNDFITHRVKNQGEQDSMPFAEEKM